MSATLPADPEKDGNVWCEECQQSLSKSRAAAHLVSKKHIFNVPATSKKAGTDADEEKAEDDEEVVVTTKKSSKKTAPGELPDDPEKAGHKWCGICQVSLSASRAEGHIETAKHLNNQVKHLSSAMKATKISK